MLGNNPLAEYEVDALVQEIASRLQPDPRVAVILMTSSIDSRGLLECTMTTGGSSQEGVILLMTALLERVQMAMSEKPNTAVLN